MFSSVVKGVAKVNVHDFASHLCQAISTHRTTNDSILSVSCKNIHSCTYKIYNHTPVKSTMDWIHPIASHMKNCTSWKNDTISNNDTTPSLNLCHNFNYIIFILGLLIGFALCVYFCFLIRCIKKEFMYVYVPFSRNAEHNIYTSNKESNGLQNSNTFRAVEERAEALHENVEEEENQGENIYENIDPSTSINVENHQATFLSPQHEITRL